MTGHYLKGAIDKKKKKVKFNLMSWVHFLEQPSLLKTP